jgi:diguanylate cyclase (GGDEF)-like protein/PAS domain S-box-containing protein
MWAARRVADAGHVSATSRERAETSLLESALSDPLFVMNVLDGLKEGLYIVDRQRTIRFWNQACEQLTGYRAQEVLGRRCFDDILRHVDENGCQLCVGMCPLAHTMRDGERRQVKVWLHHKLGHRLPVRVDVQPMRDQSGQITGAIETFVDDSSVAAVRERVAELEQLAMVDDLTGLPNRRYLELTLSNRLAELRRGGSAFVVAFGDIDHFKHVNDRHGHETGDIVLQMIATTLTGDLRGSDLLARFGGEEFILLLHHSHDALTVCERLRKLVAASSIRAPTGPVAVTISFGATRAVAGETAEMVLQRADRQLYRSKRTGRNRTTTDFD